MDAYTPRTYKELTLEQLYAEGIPQPDDELAFLDLRYGGQLVDCTDIDLATAASPPKITVALPEGDREEDEIFTLGLFDVDPSETNALGQSCHCLWLVTGIAAGAAGPLSGGCEAVPYAAPTNGGHRCVAILYRQAGGTVPRAPMDRGTVGTHTMMNRFGMVPVTVKMFRARAGAAAGGVAGGAGSSAGIGASSARTGASGASSTGTAGSGSARSGASGTSGAIGEGRAQPAT